MADRQIRFLGAARNVTGSCFCVDIDGLRIVVDCGLYQERDLKARNWAPFAMDPKSIYAVLLTHGHLDHCGLLPRLAAQGYEGPVYCTAATAEIAGIVMQDSGHIQEEDAAYKRKRHEKEGRLGQTEHPEAPLYTQEDALRAFGLMQPVDYKQPVKLADGLTAEFHDAGHILGSSMITLDTGSGPEKRRILFSGDIGRLDAPLIEDPTLFKSADYVLCESTYGNRDHKPNKVIPEQLADIINAAVKSQGKIVIPSFAVERSQELLYYLGILLAEKRIPKIPVFLDSPMAIRVTRIFLKHPELFDDDAVELMRKGEHPCDFPELVETRTADESREINEAGGPAIIIAGSGMCTGGRIKHHLKNVISDPKNTVLFIGYQASGTLGRIILEGEDEVRIHGQMYPVSARIEKINGFSAHADRSELFRWLSALKSPPRKLFVVHGENDAAQEFGAYVKERKAWNVIVPQYQDIEPLD